ncbi:uncharacterized protein BJ212DRAFT_1485099 [Suillus subaureus]|uniref:Uncharacterized protein n=1 Tax=Suillus subaureus TaxID=48587 RepID=A0A9P7E117_9AGAM|nr:uncharacterized protein BJ212DRAFT_1485099 [Suillus subaureus]KAG1808443.1 hypothetical protein BJ212DRAFT_1485099 [Suillus subaureus]
MAFPQPYNPYNPGFQHEVPDSDFDELVENSPFDIAVTLCPNCKKQCQSAEAVLEHLNSSTVTTRADRLIGKVSPHLWLPLFTSGSAPSTKYSSRNAKPSSSTSQRDQHMTQINKFPKLDWFQTREWLQFKSKDELFFYMQQLPGHGPKWQCTKLKLKGYESEQPIHLIWRDGLEVMKQLFANPDVFRSSEASSSSPGTHLADNILCNNISNNENSDCYEAMDEVPSPKVEVGSQNKIILSLIG